MTKECPKCGEKNLDNSHFCKNCGIELNEVTKPQKRKEVAKPPKSSKSGPMGWWEKQSNFVKGLSIVGVCCVGLILLLFIGSIVFPDTSTTTTTPTSTSTTTPTTTSSLETYTGGGVTFQYPKEWTTYTPEEVDPEEIINLKTTKGDTSILTVFAEDDSGEDLDYWKDVLLDASESRGTVTSQKDLTIAGVNGYRIDLLSSSSDAQQSWIFFLKNGKIYKLLFTTGSLSAISSDMDTIVNSFKTT